MHIFVVIGLSLAAGWLVNVTADALPDRKPFLSVWRQPLTTLGCAIRRQADACDEMYTLRTLLTWIAALGLGCLAYARMGVSAEAGIVALYSWFLLAVAVIDVEHRRVLNRMLLAALPVVVLVILAAKMSSPHSFILTPSPGLAIVGASIGFGVFFLTALLRPGGMGMGDVKLAGLIGLATGAAGVAVALVVMVVVW